MSTKSVSDNFYVFSTTDKVPPNMLADSLNKSMDITENTETERERRYNKRSSIGDDANTGPTQSGKPPANKKAKKSTCDCNDHQSSSQNSSSSALDLILDKLGALEPKATSLDKKLDTFDTLKTSMDSITSSITKMEATITELKAGVSKNTENVHKLQSEVSNVTNQFEDIIQQFDDFRSQRVALEMEVKKINLIVSGIDDAEEESENQLADKLQTEISKVKKDFIFKYDTVRRLGKYKKGTTRPIQVRFEKMRDRDEFYNIKSSMKRPVYINADVPEVVRKAEYAMRQKIRDLKATKTEISSVDWKCYSIVTASVTFKLSKDLYFEEIENEESQNESQPHNTQAAFLGHPTT